MICSAFSLNLQVATTELGWVTFFSLFASLSGISVLILDERYRTLNEKFTSATKLNQVAQIGQSIGNNVAGAAINMIGRMSFDERPGGFDYDEDNQLLGSDYNSNNGDSEYSEMENYMDFGGKSIAAPTVSSTTEENPLFRYNIFVGWLGVLLLVLHFISVLVFRRQIGSYKKVVDKSESRGKMDRSLA